MCTHCSGLASKDVDSCRFSSQQKLSFCSIGMRVGLIFLDNAFDPLSFLRVQNLTAAKPNVEPPVVTARLECINSSQTVCTARLLLTSLYRCFTRRSRRLSNRLSPNRLATNSLLTLSLGNAPPSAVLNSHVEKRQ